MQSTATSFSVTVHRHDWRGWGCLLFTVVLLFLVFGEALARLVHQWETQPEYSFGYLIPFISAFLVWQRKAELERLVFAGSWWGLALAAIGLLAWGLGRLSTLDTLAHYAFVMVLAGLALAYVGPRGLRLLAVPLIMLLFMVPLPNYLLRELSGALQLISSQLGVSFIRLCGVSVFLEGNVIDLGSMKLQVVEACDGLRYLFPLLTLSFIAAYFYRAPMWKRAIVFLSAIPISVFMNSLRIGLIGITVDRWGRAMAEGVLHDFEGWVIFMISMGLLLAEIWFLTKLAGAKMRDVFNVQFPESSPTGAKVRYRPVAKSYLAALAALALAALAAQSVPKTYHLVPKRTPFSQFPMVMDEWRGRPESLGSVYLEQLQLADYLLATYSGASLAPVNLYVSYYDTQAKGNSAHSPRDCIPGDGWEVKSLEKYELPSTEFNKRTLIVNRAVIRKAETTQLVYYWFQQRGRIVAGEYWVKLYLFWDLIARQRSDGAMVRLVTLLHKGEDEAAADQRLGVFVQGALPRLRQFIPE
ncbi:MAG: VPLPA-CTERM-specific exosortase XrtD [Burkholderiales bacterium]